MVECLMEGRRDTRWRGQESRQAKRKPPCGEDAFGHSWRRQRDWFVVDEQVKVFHVGCDGIPRV